MKTEAGSVSGTTPKTTNTDSKRERLISSGRSARRTRYRCRFEHGRTYAGEEIDDDPSVCLECREPSWKCTGEEECYIRHKAMRERTKRKDVSEMLLDKWKPTGIYDIWGENL